MDIKSQVRYSSGNNITNQTVIFVGSHFFIFANLSGLSETNCPKILKFLLLFFGSAK